MSLSYVLLIMRVCIAKRADRSLRSTFSPLWNDARNCKTKRGSSDPRGRALERGDWTRAHCQRSVCAGIGRSHYQPACVVAHGNRGNPVDDV